MNPLLLEEVTPLITQVIHLRLKGIAPGEADDVRQNVLVKLLQWLRRPTSENRTIENFADFAARTAHNECHNYLRDKSPARLRLKNNLRNLLSRHDDFAVWKSSHRTLCGFAVWGREARTASLVSSSAQLDKAIEPFCRTPSLAKNQNVSTGYLVTEIFRAVGAPIELNQLVELVAGVKGICLSCLEQELIEESLAVHQRASELTTRYDERVGTHDLLRRVWQFLLALPLVQRRAYLYTNDDGNGESLLLRLLLEGIVSISEVRAGVARQ